MPDPKQRGNRKLDGSRQQTTKRAEPAIGEPDREAHHSNTRQRSFDDMASSDEHDLVKRTCRQNGPDHHDAERRLGQQPLSRQRGARQRRRSNAA
jgi:hypothetical protein